MNILQVCNFCPLCVNLNIEGSITVNNEEEFHTIMQQQHIVHLHCCNNNEGFMHRILYGDNGYRQIFVQRSLTVYNCHREPRPYYNDCVIMDQVFLGNFIIKSFYHIYNGNMIINDYDTIFDLEYGDKTILVDIPTHEKNIFNFINFIIAKLGYKLESFYSTIYELKSTRCVTKPAIKII